MAENYTYERWSGDVPIEYPIDPQNADDIIMFIKEALRVFDRHNRVNDDAISESVSLQGRFRGVFDLDVGVDVGHVVYITGGRAYKADISDYTKRPMAVVESIIGTSSSERRGVCWYGQGDVTITTSDTSVTVGGYLYLSSTNGVVTGNPPDPDGSTITYMAPIGWALDDVSNGKVLAVFNPQMIVRMV